MHPCNDLYTTVCGPALARIESKVDAIDRTMRGSNGSPGLVSRLARLEEARGAGRVWGRRLWQAGVAVGLLILGYLLKGV